MAISLYDLTEQLVQLEELIEQGEIDDDVLLDTWESIDAVFEDKADAYAKVMADMGATVDALKAEEKRLADRRKTIENATKRMKERLQAAMVAADKKKFKTDLFSYTIQKNPARVVIDDEKKVPIVYQIRQAPKFDLTMIKRAFDNGGTVNGAHLEQGESLRIR